MQGIEIAWHTPCVPHAYVCPVEFPCRDSAGVLNTFGSPSRNYSLSQCFPDTRHAARWNLFASGCVFSLPGIERVPLVTGNSNGWSTGSHATWLNHGFVGREMITMIPRPLSMANSCSTPPISAKGGNMYRVSPWPKYQWQLPLNQVAMHSTVQLVVVGPGCEQVYVRFTKFMADFRENLLCKGPFSLVLKMPGCSVCFYIKCHWAMSCT